ncbi:MAG: nuclear transport factor 2 family protein [Nitrospirota bacterium]|nr:nuclear transport factor 2 family protein [Nitrospirota bacterium]
MTTAEQKAAVLSAVKQASVQWQSAFNSGDAAGCAAQYEKSAVMHARPFGTFMGTSEIQAFWQKLIDDGFSDVEYVDPHVEVVDEASAILTSGWTMNKASGVIHKELWVMQTDGTAKLREDDFEAKG